MDILKTAEQKIKSPIDISQAFQPLKGQYPLVTTNGCFDLLHYGHLKSLAFANEYSPYLVVLINSDNSVKKLKSIGRPIQADHDRAIALACLSFVWRVAIFQEDTPLEALKIIKPDIHIKGEEYKDKEIPEKKWIESYGGKMIFAPAYKGISTSTLIAKIKSLS